MSRSPSSRLAWRAHLLCVAAISALLGPGACAPRDTDAKTGREIRTYRLPSPSMAPTIGAKERVRVSIFPDSSAALAELERGDVVAHRYPPDTTKLFLKRIVGLPGDTLAMRAGRLLLNGRAVDEPYAWHSDSGPAGLGDAGAAEFMWQSRYLATQTGDDGGGTRLGYHPSRNNWGPLVVPPRAFFVLGDNRDYSLDSRYWGFVPAREIVGLLIDKRPNATP